MFDIYKTSLNNFQRYVIGKSGSRPLHVIGLNPSTAHQNKSDTTITKIERFALKNNYNGFLVYNLYPQRATNPDDLPYRSNSSIIKTNSDLIYNYISDSKQLDVWVAWGQMIEKRSYLIKSLSKIAIKLEPLNPNWIMIGSTTKSGHPRHPSRISYRKTFSSFDIYEYMNKLKDNQRM